MTHEIEYHSAMVTFLEMVWGKGFMVPGGEGHVANMISGSDIRNKHILDIGCGIGGPAFLLTAKYGAYVVGTDLEEHLIKRAQDRAAELSLNEQTEFMVVKPGLLTFPDESYDVVFVSGAFTQVENKRQMYQECLRVLKPGGTLTCYDWMKTEGDYSEDMLYWFKMEGLTYAMETTDHHEAILREVGFSAIEITDRSDWYRRRVREEYEMVKSELYPRLVELIGQKDADHFVENWRATVIVCEKGEMLQVYTRAQKPL